MDEKTARKIWDRIVFHLEDTSDGEFWQPDDLVRRIRYEGQPLKRVEEVLRIAVDYGLLAITGLETGGKRRRICPPPPPGWPPERPKSIDECHSAKQVVLLNPEWPAKRPRDKRGQKWQAVGIVKASPHLSDREIAEMVGVSPSTLSRYEAYQAVANVARGVGESGRIPRGFRQDGDIEALERE